MTEETDEDGAGVASNGALGSNGGVSGPASGSGPEGAANA